MITIRREAAVLILTTHRLKAELQPGCGPRFDAVWSSAFTRSTAGPKVKMRIAGREANDDLVAIRRVNELSFGQPGEARFVAALRDAGAWAGCRATTR